MGDGREHSQMSSSENMDDDSGLELSLGLSCGGFGCKTKVKDASKEINSEQRTGDQVKRGKISGDTFVTVDLCGSTSEENNEVKQLNEAVPPAQQSFWMNLGKAAGKETENSTELHVNQVQFSGFREPWFTGETSTQKTSADTEKAKRDKQDRMTIFKQQHEAQEPDIARELAEEKMQEARKKQKITVEEQKQQTIGDKEDDRDDPHCKSKSGIPSHLKSSPISANTQDASSSENEDTADSEVEAALSKTVSPIVKNNAKQPMPLVSDASDKIENQMPITRTMVIGSDINKEHSSASFMTPVATTSTALPYSHPSINVGHASYSHSFQVATNPSAAFSANNPSAAFSAGFPFPYLMQFGPSTVNGSDRSAAYPANSTGIQLPPGNAPFQLPALETSPSWVSVSHSHQPLMFGSKTIGGARKSSEHADDESKISQVQPSQVSLGVISASGERTLPGNQKPESANPLMRDERQAERTCLDRGTSLSSKAGDENAKHAGAWSKEHTGGLTQEVWNLRPGIAPGLKFGGTGNSPDLPWVSTGSNGKSISGVMYRYNTKQIKIVCACHGRHMSPAEFVQHGNDADVSNLDNNVVANPFPSGNQPTSAQG